MFPHLVPTVMTTFGFFFQEKKTGILNAMEMKQFLFGLDMHENWKKKRTWTYINPVLQGFPSRVIRVMSIFQIFN